MEAHAISAIFYAVDAEGVARDVRINIGIPAKTGKVDYWTSVEVSGIGSRDMKEKVVGVDPIQSLLIATSFVKSRLRQFESKGGVIYLQPGREAESRYSSDMWVMLDSVNIAEVCMSADK